MIINDVILKDGKWFWPKIDENSWEGQNNAKNLHEIVLKYVKNKNIMIQAGGNCGFILSHFVKHFNAIYTFEPDPINFYCLCNNITSPNVYKLQACLGDKQETVQTQQLIRVNRLHDIGGVHVNGDGSTPTIIIDNLNLKDCNLIQLDVEGYELKALKGAYNTIKKYKPVLCIELCEKWLNRYNTNSDEIFKFLNELGYSQVDEHQVDKIFVSN
jgi:FkbM family methyltransferase